MKSCEDQPLLGQFPWRKCCFKHCSDTPIARKHVGYRYAYWCEKHYGRYIVKKKKEQEKRSEWNCPLPPSILAHENAALDEEKIKFVEKYGLSTKDFLITFNRFYSIYFSLNYRKKPFASGETVEQRKERFMNEIAAHGLGLEIFEEVRRIKRSTVE